MFKKIKKFLLSRKKEKDNRQQMARIVAAQRAIKTSNRINLMVILNAHPPLLQSDIIIAQCDLHEN